MGWSDCKGSVGFQGWVWTWAWYWLRLAWKACVYESDNFGLKRVGWVQWVRPRTRPHVSHQFRNIVVGWLLVFVNKAAVINEFVFACGYQNVWVYLWLFEIELDSVCVGVSMSHLWTLCDWGYGGDICRFHVINMYKKYYTDAETNEWQRKKNITHAKTPCVWVSMSHLLYLILFLLTLVFRETSEASLGWLFTILRDWY